MQVSTRPHFKFPFDADFLNEMMLTAYEIEVNRRGLQFINDEDTRKNIRLMCEYLTSDSYKSGLILCGTCGNGKTTLVFTIRAMINALQDRGYFDFLKQQNFHVGLWIVDARDIVIAAKREIDTKIGDSTFKEMKKYNMLAIEDLGKEPAEYQSYGNTLSPITELIEHRYSQQLFTIITTNLTGKQIREHYGARIADRFNEMLFVIPFTRQSFRR